jgi:hypothetical protein
MSLDEQKKIFLKTAKAIKAVAYSYKWFSDFNNTKLEALYLLLFYQDSIVNSNGDEQFNDYIEESYEALFWYWFNKRYERLMNEKYIAEANAEYEALIKELEDENIFDWLGLGAVQDWIPWILAGVIGIIFIKAFKQ